MAASARAARPGVTGTDDAEAREVGRERLALRLSAAAAATAGVVGVGWGLAVESSVVLLDGVYALVGMLLSLLTLRVAAAVTAEPSERYPFGREALGPLMVGAQGLVLLGTLLYAGVEALLAIRAGGSDASVASALLYAALSLLLALGLLVVLRRIGTTSELVAAEAIQWRAGAVLSLVMTVGFAVGVALDRGGASAAARFVDPTLVLAACVLLVPAPVRMLRTALRELLEAAPDPAVAGPVHAAVDAVSAQYSLPEPRVRLGKLGRKLYVELDYLVEPHRFEVGDADLVRRALIARLAEPGRLLWVNVELHTDPHWDE